MRSIHSEGSPQNTGPGGKCCLGTPQGLNNSVLRCPRYSMSHRPVHYRDLSHLKEEYICFSLEAFKLEAICYLWFWEQNSSHSFCIPVSLSTCSGGMRCSLALQPDVPHSPTDHTGKAAKPAPSLLNHACGSLAYHVTFSALKTAATVTIAQKPHGALLIEGEAHQIIFQSLWFRCI